ncbi:LytTR family DNA-binding domain-containing protein [Sphingomicrobium sp. XHP0239]|uniref:LytR/AlgR family response regulator transcription factor n=1 Tax=Sphingomicrobium maritimum TaxID=3133972 RepID=UPI0031CCAE34
MIAYVIAFAATGQYEAGRTIEAAFRNSLPAVLLGMLADIVLRPLWNGGRAWRLILLVPGALLYTFGWYAAVVVFIAAREGGWFAGGFTVEPFTQPVNSWFLFQGISYFAVAAALSYAGHLHRMLVTALAERGATPSAGNAPILVRVDGDLRAFDPSDILIASGAGDYVELVTRNERLLTGGSLGEYERRLPEQEFVRLHRSHLVALAAIARAEPAGNGRTTVHLVNGDSIISSRAGSARLRERSF